MRTKSLLGAAAVAAALCFATAAFGAHYTGTVNISAANEVPVNASPATGIAYIELDTAANTLTYHITYSGLTTAETAAHIHGFAAAGANAGVLHPLPATAGVKDGTWTYLEAQEADILAGRTYINIHTSGNPGGEIRGQIARVFPANHVPAASTWALGLMSLGLLVTAGVAVRRHVRA
jgi:hypothetical protein